MSRLSLSALAGFAAVVLGSAPLAAQDFKVIVNPANSITELPASTAGKLFLKELSKFPNGSAASPVDLGKASPVRASFSKSVVGRPASAVETYWQQQIFSGKEVPPPSKSSDDDVIAFVKSTPGGIGYVSDAASTSGVKVIVVK